MAKLKDPCLMASRLRFCSSGKVLILPLVAAVLCNARQLLWPHIFDVVLVEEECVFGFVVQCVPEMLSSSFVGDLMELQLGLKDG